MTLFMTVLFFIPKIMVPASIFIPKMREITAQNLPV